MEFVQDFTPPDFQAKNFTPPISPNFNIFSKKKHKKWVKMEKFYTAAGSDGMDKSYLWLVTSWSEFSFRILTKIQPQRLVQTSTSKSEPNLSYKISPDHQLKLSNHPHKQELHQSSLLNGS